MTKRLQTTIDGRGGLARIGAYNTGSATDELVDRFAAALKEKLRAAEAKYGRNDAWLRSDWRDELVQHLQEHVQKGDPRDVAAYCAFAWHHGWTVQAQNTQEAGHE